MTYSFVTLGGFDFSHCVGGMGRAGMPVLHGLTFYKVVTSKFRS